MYRLAGASTVVLLACSDEPRSRAGEPTHADRERFSGRYVAPQANPPSNTAPTLETRITGDPDHDFLRHMSDHHTGLIVLTHAAIESNRSPSFQPAIRKLEDDHDHELDIILSMLRRIYKDEYLPGAPRECNFMAQTLRAGTSDSTTFFRSALKIEEQALQIINDYLPKATNAQVRRLAEELRRDEPREIAAIRKLLNQP
ncbi:MAG TPA: DUF305 domain-containing protein [Gemmatimonadaceae bacterium]|nr:DUF305 domain-containing protein [Gemmatimonadaceae bacterium]